MSISTVQLAGRPVGQIGLGLMQLTWTPSPVSDEKAFAAMKAATDAGATAWSSATFYGNPGHQMDNIALIGRFFKKYPEYKDKVSLVIKGGVDESLHPINDLEANRALLKETQELLGADVPISVYLPARLDLAQGKADPVKYMAPFDELRKEGLFGALGVSEVRVETLEKLATAYSLAVVEIEVSLWSYEQEIQDVIAWSTKTGTPVFAYSPLGRGFITRTYKTPEDIPEGSFQRYVPRFQGDAFYHNLKLVDQLDAIAAQRNLTTAQLAIAWVASRGPNVIPIPGSSNPERAQQNVESASIELSPEDTKAIDDMLAQFDLKGGRYPAAASDHLMI